MKKVTRYCVHVDIESTPLGTFSTLDYALDACESYAAELIYEAKDPMEMRAADEAYHEVEWMKLAQLTDCGIFHIEEV